MKLEITIKEKKEAPCHFESQEELERWLARNPKPVFTEKPDIRDLWMRIAARKWKESC